MRPIRLLVQDFIRAGRGMVRLVTRPQSPKLLQTACFSEKRTVNVRAEFGTHYVGQIWRTAYRWVEARRIAPDSYQLVEVWRDTHREFFVTGGYLKAEGVLVPGVHTLADATRTLRAWETQMLNAGKTLARTPDSTPLHYRPYIKPLRLRDTSSGATP